MGAGPAGSGQVAISSGYEKRTGNPKDAAEGCGTTKKEGKKWEVARLEQSQTAEEDI